MSSTGAGANFNWLPFTLMSLTEWERPWVTKGLVVWLAVLFKLELVIEFALGVEAEFELRLQFAVVVVVELELELELLSWVEFGLIVWRFGLGVDFDLDFILGFAHDVELRVTVWSVSRLVGSDAESGDTDILAGVDFDDPASVASWLADWDRIAWPPSLSFNAIW